MAEIRNTESGDILTTKAPKRASTAKGTSPAKRKPRKPDTPPQAEKPKWRRVLRFVLLYLNLLVAGIFLLSAFNGYISPLKWGGYWGILGLAFPWLLMSLGITMVIDVLLKWKMVFIPLVAFVIAIGPVTDYFPLHIIKPHASKEARTLKVMSYNVYNFWEHNRDNLGLYPRNRTLATVMDSGADLICLQETDIFGPVEGNKIYPEDMSLLTKLYPYIMRTGHFITLLSKYPVEPIHLDYSRRALGCDIGCYRVHIDEDMDITVFNLHLQSLGLTSEDFKAYRDLTSGHPAEKDIAELKSSILTKLAYANKERARQIQKICRYIEVYGGPNVILCGDFNDVANCYSIRRLEQMGLREVYPAVGLGPITTYNARKLYFGIDHIFWRGKLKPLWLKRGNIPSSDHYPITVEFEIL